MKYCLLIASALLILGSCKKVDSTVSKAQMLRDTKWTIDTWERSYLSYNGTDSLTVSTFGVSPDYTKPDCIKDDYLEFKQNHDGSHITGPNKCKTGETDDIYFSWGLTENDTKMYMYNLIALFDEDVTGELKEINTDKFTFTYDKMIPGGPLGTQKVKITVKFKKK